MTDAMTEPNDLGARYRVEFDGFVGTVIGFYKRHGRPSGRKPVTQEEVAAMPDGPLKSLLMTAPPRHDYPACAVFRGGKCTCDEGTDDKAAQPMQGLGDYLRATARAMRLDEDRNALLQWAREVDAARGVMGTQTGPVAWEYANSHGDKFLTHKDPAKWHPHDRAGFKDFRPLAYADGVKGPDKC